jgi:hypothetical protein
LYRENTLASLRAAVALIPANAAYRALLAEHMEGFGMNPDSQLLTAARLSPLESKYWIRLGFRAEVEGDYASAEKYLLHSAQLDRQFDPRWALLNYYFRRGNYSHFWTWTDQAFPMSHGDLTPLFRLMWDVTDDAGIIRKHIPERRETFVQYTSFLLANGHREAAAGIAPRAAALAKEDDVPVLVGFCDSELQTDPLASLSVWNILCSRRLLPFAPLDAKKGKLVTNGEFRTPVTGRGLDWRVPSVEGVSIDADPKGLSIRLDGSEPEDCVLLTQTFPVPSPGRYAVDYEYAAPADGHLDGLQWELRRQGRDAPVASIPLMAGRNSLQQSLPFTSDGAEAIRLGLKYHRPVGSTRAEGVILLRRIETRMIR